MSTRRKIAVIVCIVCCTACGDDDATPAADAGGADAGTSVTETCEATLTWYQKDAYKETAGRTSAFWPPHTTMGLEVVCTPVDSTPEVVASTWRSNHGTSPEDVDAAGTTILDDVRLEFAQGTRAELSELVSAFDICECGTVFLSLDALSDSVVEQLVGELVAYITANLTCTGAGGTPAVVDALTMGNIEQVLVLGADCMWSAGRSWEEGFDEALTTVIAASSEVLADYHVCNNDAELQAELFRGFVSTGLVTACDPASALCSSPRWFYSP